MYRSGQAGGVRAPQGLCTAQQPAGSGRRFGHPKSLLCPLAQSQVGGHAPVPLPLRGRTGTRCHCKVRAASPLRLRVQPSAAHPRVRVRVRLEEPVLAMSQTMLCRTPGS